MLINGPRRAGGDAERPATERDLEAGELERERVRRPMLGPMMADMVGALLGVADLVLFVVARGGSLLLFLLQGNCCYSSSLLQCLNIANTTSHPRSTGHQPSYLYTPASRPHQPLCLPSHQAPPAAAYRLHVKAHALVGATSQGSASAWLMAPIPGHGMFVPPRLA